MTKLKIPHNALIFVGDGRKALFLRNDGDEEFPNLKTEGYSSMTTRRPMSRTPIGRAAVSQASAPHAARSKQPIGMSWKSTALGSL